MDNVDIDDETLINLLEYPAFAFEIGTDSDQGKEKLRLKSAYLREQAKLIRSFINFIHI